MKIMIASDIHGSAYYCELMLRTFESENADRLLLLGDILYHGPRNDLPEGYDPKKVADLLNNISEKIICVRGNCDADVDLMVLSFPMTMECAVVPIGEKMMYATHGHVYNPDSLPPVPKGDMLLYGHTHVPELRESGGVMCINPGSVSLPKCSSAHSCILLKDGIFGWKDLETGDYYRYYDSLADEKHM
jgi:hypothetical protein